MISRSTRLTNLGLGIRCSLFLLMIGIPLNQCFGSPAHVNVHILDDRDQAVAGAKVSMHRWTGEFEPTKFNAVTNAAGLAEIRALPSEESFYVAVEADGWASIFQALQLDPSTTRTITLRLAKPVHATVRVIDQEGKPVSGVVLSTLSLVDANGEGLFYRHGRAVPYEFKPTESDAAGIIKLPALPGAAKVSLKTLHQDYLCGVAENLVATTGELATIRLTAGVPLRLRFVPGNGLSKLPEDLPVYLSLQPKDSKLDRSARINHLFRPDSDTIHLNVAPQRFRYLHIKSEHEQFAISPLIDDDDEVLRELLDFTNTAREYEIELVVRKRIPVRGVITGQRDLLTSGSYIYGEADSVHAMLPSGQRSKRPLVFFAQVDKNGSYQLLLPPGRSRISLAGMDSGVTVPAEIEVDVLMESETTVPDLVLKKLQPIRGRIVDEQGNPITNAVVRLQVGYWGSDHVRCDDDGKFELPVGLLAQTSNHADEGKSFSAMVLAIAPDSGKCGWKDLADWQRGIPEIQVECQSRQADAVMQAITKNWEAAGEQTKFKRKIDELKAELARKKQRYAAGEVGKIPPDMAQGTWLNSDAKSLRDFLGKYVLLDFWFIGCGPCQADLPSVKLVHELFGPEKFTVVSVHMTSQSAENVKQYAITNGMTFPIVVDNAKGELEKEFAPLGLQGFPSYILLDPEGRIVHNDMLNLGPSLREFKFELIEQYLRAGKRSGRE